MDFNRNNLDHESSPYLHQHQNNPVHWQPWTSEVLDYARLHDKPLLLSVGYAACHWCHVMAHESFENSDIAAVMNNLFVNIKVDREERPDIDMIYQTALQLLGQQGGWPLTMFLTSNGEPFWGGTYFPDSARFGRPGFVEVLTTIERTYREHRDQVDHNRQALVDALNNLATGGESAAIRNDIADDTATKLLQITDMRYGGIGDAPKFPHVPELSLIWREWKRTGRQACRDAVITAADAMARGGIYDHLGGGWARYSVDRFWLVPHFEKMLYDNSQLIEFYTMLWLETGRDLYRRRIAETIDWLQREMTSPNGAFYSSLDADSETITGENEEGAFYVWSEDEVDTVLGSESPSFKLHYGVTKGGNWEGKTILNCLSAEPDVETELRLAPLRKVLLDHRANRPRPGLDDKILADWNGLMIRALARAGAAFNRLDWIAMAIRAFDCVSNTMAVENRLRHSARESQVLPVAMLDDYSHMADAALALHEVTGHPSMLEQGSNWARTAIDHYWDSTFGGFFYTSDDAEALIVRSRTALDNATPSGNGTMVGVLSRLWHLTGESIWRTYAEKTAHSFAREIERQPSGHCVMLANLDLLERGVHVVIIRERSDQATDALLHAVWRAARRDVVVSVCSSTDNLPTSHPAFAKSASKGLATAFVCREMTCSLPVTRPEDVAKLLSYDNPSETQS